MMGPGEPTQHPLYETPDSFASGDRKTSYWHRLASSSLIYILILLCVLALAISISGIGGAVAGQRERDLRATQTTIVDLNLQFTLGLDDLQAGRYELAAQRFRWILQRDPARTDVAAALDEAERRLLNPDTTPTPTRVPAASGQDLETLFAEASDYYARQQWENAIIRLQEIQARDAGFREVEVKQTLHTALKTLGLIYIRGDRIEEGILLLEQAREIRPLDDLTEGEIYLATLYLTGRSYKQLNWAIAIQNFEALYAVAPTYRDVESQLLESYKSYGAVLTAQNAWCEAEQVYEAALTLENSAELQEEYEAAHRACSDPFFQPPSTTPGGPATQPLPTGQATQEDPFTGIPTPRPTRTPTPGAGN